MIGRRRVGAIANYKRALKRIRKERANAPQSSAHIIRPDLGGDGVRVWQNGQPVAGPFDTREDAQAWIDDPQR